MATTATPKRLSDRVKPWMVRAIKKHSPDEEVVWDVAVNAFPDPSATAVNADSADPSDSEGSLPVLVLYFEIAGPEPETSMCSAPILPPYQLTEESIDYAVRVTLEELRQKRQRIIDGEDEMDEDPFYDAVPEETPSLELIP